MDIAILQRVMNTRSERLLARYARRDIKIISQTHLSLFKFMLLS